MTSIAIGGPALALALALAACAPDKAAPPLHVPRASRTAIPGSPDDPAWTDFRAGRTGPFVLPGGTAAVPYADARFTWNAGELHVVLYAADQDIRSGDAFVLSFAPDPTTEGPVRSLDVSPAGIVTRGVGGVWSTHDLDGTLDDSSDADEEWVVAVTIPLASLGLAGQPGERIGLTIRRCDAPGSNVSTTCSSWGEGGGHLLVLD
jgi:hypothetical protein